MKLTKSLLPLLLAVGLVTGCSTGTPTGGETPQAESPTAHPTTSSSPTPTPTTSATPPPEEQYGEDGGGDGEVITDTVIDVISLQPYYVYLMNAEGQVVDSVWYGDPPKLAAAKFEAAFGTAPVTTPNAGDPTQIGRYTWGGVSIRADGYFEPFMGRRYTVEVSVASQGGVAIETANGWHVGSPAGPIESQYDSYRDGGVMTAVVSLSPDQYNRVYLMATDPYTVITSFKIPDGA